MFWYLIGIVVVCLIVVIGARHRHRWGPWEDYTATMVNGTQQLVQVKTCRDSKCCKKKSRRYLQ